MDSFSALQASGLGLEMCNFQMLKRHSQKPFVCSGKCAGILTGFSNAGVFSSFDL